MNWFRSANTALLLSFIMSLLVAGCGGGGATTVGSGAVTLQSVAVTPANPSLAAGTTQQMVATGTYSNGSTNDITASVTWNSASTVAATVNASGVVSAVAPGTSVITATDGATGVSGSTTVTVTAAVLTSIVVTPASPSIVAGATQQMTATGTFSDGTQQNITGSVNWSSSNTAFATVSSPGGLVTGVAAGPATITATDSATGVTANTTVTVTAAVLTSISFTPASPSLAAGTTLQMKAVGNYSDSTQQDITGSVNWSSSNTAVATVSSPGGLVTGVSANTATITATDPTSGVSLSATVTVTPAVLKSISFTPASPSLAKGTQLQMKATGSFSDGTQQDITSSVNWSSSDALIATVSSPGGLITGVGQGTATITATDPATGVTNGVAVTVTPPVLTSISFTPASPSLVAGTTLQMMATGTLSDGTTTDVTSSVNWSSSDTAVATVSNTAGSNGLVTGVSANTATITATDPTTGVTNGVTVTVTAPVTLTSISVTPAGSNIPVGGTQQMKATGTYSDSSTKDITSSVNWTSSNTLFATVSNTAGSNGLVTGVAAGAPTITATDSTSGVSGSTTITVTASINEIFVSVGSNPAEVMIFPRTANGTNVTPSLAIASTTAFVNPSGIMVDRVNGKIDVLDSGGYGNAAGAIQVFNLTDGSAIASPQPTTTPQQVISGGNTGLNYPWGIFVDTTNNELYVANWGTSVGSGGSITVYKRTDNGNVAPQRTIASSLMANPSGVSVDVANNLIYVADYTNNYVLVFNRTDQGTNVTPVKIIANTGMSLPNAAIVDPAHSEFYVPYGSGSGTSSSVAVFPTSTASGVAATTSRLINGTGTGLNTPYSVSVDNVNNEIAVANDTGNSLASITLYSRTANGTSVTPSSTIQYSNLYDPTAVDIEP